MIMVNKIPFLASRNGRFEHQTRIEIVTGPIEELTASSEHNTIRGLIEARDGPAAELAPVTFLQGSYRQQTAIYEINDVDIVALCKLWYPGNGIGGGRNYGRDEIFRIIAAPLLA